MTPEELALKLKEQGIEKTAEELLQMSEDELLILLALVAEKEGSTE